MTVAGVSRNPQATLPTALDSEHQNLLDDLTAENARTLSKVTIRTSSRRTGMRSLCRGYAKAGDNTDLKSWAGQALAKLKEHLSMAEKLK